MCVFKQACSGRRTAAGRGRPASAAAPAVRAAARLRPGGGGRGGPCRRALASPAAAAGVRVGCGPRARKGAGGAITPARSATRSPQPGPAAAAPACWLTRLPAQQQRVAWRPGQFRAVRPRLNPIRTTTRRGRSGCTRWQQHSRPPASTITAPCHLRPRRWPRGAARRRARRWGGCTRPITWSAWSLFARDWRWAAPHCFQCHLHRGEKGAALLASATCAKQRATPLDFCLPQAPTLVDEVRPAALGRGHFPCTTHQRSQKAVRARAGTQRAHALALGLAACRRRQRTTRLTGVDRKRNAPAFQTPNPQSTYIAPASFSAGLEAMAAVLACLDAVMRRPPDGAGSGGSGQSSSDGESSDGPDAAGAGRARGCAGFCVVRPPGHHVMPSRPMGFGVRLAVACFGLSCRLSSLSPPRSARARTHAGTGTSVGLSTHNHAPPQTQDAPNATKTPKGPQPGVCGRRRRKSPPRHKPRVGPGYRCPSRKWNGGRV
jgi:hypothetical protein